MKVGALSLVTRGVPNVYDGELTFAGKIMAALPVDVHVARLLLLGHVFGYLDECLVIGTYMSSDLCEIDVAPAGRQSGLHNKISG